jgi:hypothetical protein
MNRECSVSVNGETEENETEEWFAQVTKFQLGTAEGRGQGQAAVTLSNPGAAKLEVQWLHIGKEVLEKLPAMPEHPEYTLMRQAIHEDHYLLATKTHVIDLDTINGM